MNKSQRGFTLIELVVATAIVGVIVVGAMGTIFQVLNVNALNNGHVLAVKQVENAVHWLGRDTQMAQVVQTSEGNGFPLTLSWVEWEGARQQVSYVLEDNRLRRSYSIDGGEPTWTVIAAGINTSLGETNCQFDSRVLTFKVTANLSGANESRTVQVIPRPAP